ncbi:MAG: hypothetical protein ACREDT_06770, partial [Methylocella sp.]
RGGMIDNRSHRGAGASPQTKSRTGTEQSQSVILQSSLIEASTSHAHWLKYRVACENYRSAM